jgi:hypothetical protein
MDFRASLKFFGLSVVAVGTYYLLKKREKIVVDHRHVVIISGSNSGLGYTKNA